MVPPDFQAWECMLRDVHSLFFWSCAVEMQMERPLPLHVVHVDLVTGVCVETPVAPGAEVYLEAGFVPEGECLGGALPPRDGDEAVDSGQLTVDSGDDRTDQTDQTDQGPGDDLPSDSAGAETSESQTGMSVPLVNGPCSPLLPEDRADGC